MNGRAGTGWRFATLVRIVICLVASVAALALAAPAFATNEGNTCGNCASINAPKDNWVKNVESYNASGLGYCDILWEKSGGSYTQVFDRCNPSTHGVIECLSYELFGHGETTRYYANLYTLEVRQDNFGPCE
jgi:hypothetical protein